MKYDQRSSCALLFCLRPARELIQQIGEVSRGSCESISSSYYHFAMADSTAPTPHRIPSNAATGSATSLPSLLPPRDPPQKRSDLLSLKQRLSQLLSPNPTLGELYWNGLTDFMLGKITRDELADVLQRVFKPNYRLEASEYSYM